jgi:hypothetical protein
MFLGPRRHELTRTNSRIRVKRGSKQKPNSSKEKRKMKALFSKKAKEAPDPVAMVNDQPKEGKPVEVGPPQSFRREGEKVIFPGKVVSPWREPEPDAASPEGEDVLQFEKIPVGQIKELLQDYPQRRKNRDGINFSGGHIRIRLRDGTTLQGWVSEVDLAKFRLAGAVKGWRPSPRR